MADLNGPPRRATIDTIDDFPPTAAAHAIHALTRSQLEHALDAHRRELKIYESLKSLNDVIGTQYGDRVLFELIQNAHDAHTLGEGGGIAIRLVIEGPARGALLVANKGRAFTASNLEAIRNIGTSDKEIGEGIGNKGLGFRSVEALTDDVHVFSAGGAGPNAEFNGYCFRFATTEEIAARLLAIGATEEIAVKVAPNVPRYLVPVAVDIQSAEVRQLAREGYATVVALPLSTSEAVELARKQVAAVLGAPAPVLLFLDRLSSLDAAVLEVGRKPARTTLTRQVEPIAADLPEGLRMERVTLDGTNSFLVARQVLKKPAVLDAVRASITAAPPLRRWLSWKGDAVVSVAVPAGGPMLASPRLFNFLPMDDRAISPMAGHIDAPFFADIDRRSIKPDLPLNKYLLEAAATTAAQAALAIVDGNLALPESAVLDLAAWSGTHMAKVVEAFATLGQPLARAAIWPVVPGGPARRVSFTELHAWPDVRTQQMTPTKLACVAKAAIVPPSIGEGRLLRLKGLASALSLSLAPDADTLSHWVESIAGHLSGNGRQTPRRWHDFYDDVVAIYVATSHQLPTLEGKKLFPDDDGKLLRATAKGLDGAPPVFHRIGKDRGKRGKGPPSPPSSLSRKFRFLKPSIAISDGSLRAFEKAGLLRRYDPLEALSGLKGALGSSPTDIQRREALLWAYRVWCNTGGGKAVEDGLRAAGFAADLQPPARPAPALALAAAALEALLPTAEGGADPWDRQDGWRLQGAGSQFLVLADGENLHRLRLIHAGPGWRVALAGADATLSGCRLDGALQVTLDGAIHRIPVLRDGDAVQVALPDGARTLRLRDPHLPPEGEAVGQGRLAAPIPGRVVQVLVAEGETVSRGQVLAVLEAMKTELRITAPADGVVAHIGCAAGDSVEEGTEIVTLVAPD